jgi:hypothetical protein
VSRGSGEAGIWADWSALRADAVAGNQTQSDGILPPPPSTAAATHRVQPQT